MKYLMMIVLLFPVTAFGVTLSADFSWDGATDPDQFVMWERTIDGKTQVATAPGIARTMEWDAGDLGTECHTYFLTAEENGVHSNPSNAYPMCPPIQLPDMTLRPGEALNLNIKIVQ